MMKVETARWNKQQWAIRELRRRVFIVEQHVAEALEWDGLDADAIHAIATINDVIVGTARLLSNGKIGRMAVLKPYRGQGIGSQLLVHLIETARHQGQTHLSLSAQTQALGFYQHHGFHPQGEIYQDAGIPHQMMLLEL